MSSSEEPLFPAIKCYIKLSKYFAKVNDRPGAGSVTSRGALVVRPGRVTSVTLCVLVLVLGALVVLGARVSIG